MVPRFNKEVLTSFLKKNFDCSATLDLWAKTHEKFRNLNDF